LLLWILRTGERETCSYPRTAQHRATLPLSLRFLLSFLHAFPLLFSSSFLSRSFLRLSDLRSSNHRIWNFEQFDGNLIENSPPIEDSPSVLRRRDEQRKRRWLRLVSRTARPPAIFTRYHISAMVFFNESETVAGMTSDTMVPNARLDVGIRSISEGATQQQSGGVVFATGASARSVLETRIKLHQHEHLMNQKQETIRTRFGLFVR